MIASEQAMKIMERGIGAIKATTNVTTNKLVKIARTIPSGRKKTDLN